MPVLHSIQIKIDGIDQTSRLQVDLVEAIVDTTLSLPGSFSLLVTNRDLVHDPDFDTGKAVEISFQPAQVGTPEKTSPLIVGIVTAIEPVFTANGTQLLRIRGYEKSIKLTQGKKTRSFRDQTYSDMVKKIISGNGLTANAASTSVTFPHVIQYNQSDWDFVLSLAHKSGFLVWTSGDKINFKQPAQGNTVDLEWPEDLNRFEPRLSFLGQAAKATASGWDAKQKTAISGTASSGNSQPYRQIGLAATGKSAVSKNVSASVAATVINLSLISTQEASATAQAQLDQAEATFVTAEGE